MTSQNLAQLPIGKQATIVSVNENFLSLKLMEMGCVPGEIVKISKVAPFGDPITISVANYSLSIRKKEAEGILVVS
jgi:ferrous iron transport protein A